MGVVVLDIAEFRDSFPGDFPEEKFPDKLVKACFKRAEGYINNTDIAYIPNPPRDMLLYLTTAHLLTLNARGRNASVVGRITSVSQGPVSMSLSYPDTPNNAWWNQTTYGAEVWMKTAKYRSFLFVTG